MHLLTRHWLLIGGCGHGRDATGHLLLITDH